MKLAILVLVTFPLTGILAPPATATNLHNEIPPVSFEATINVTVNVSTPVSRTEATFEASVSATTRDQQQRELVGDQPTPLVTCQDPAGCPDLVIEILDLATGLRPRVETFQPGNCNIEEGTVAEGERHLLRFTTGTTNYGAGRLMLGIPAQNPDWFQWGSCHGHWHLADYADYRLWTTDGYQAWSHARAAHPNATAKQIFDTYPEIVPGMVNGHKQGFCVIDLAQKQPFSPSHYWSCNNQGLSPGWEDIYHWNLDGQWVDVTDLPGGFYVLEIEVNADRLFEESDYGNNSAALPFYLPEPSLW
jgi:hypothetical protein